MSAWVTAAQAAEALGVSERHAIRLCKPFAVGRQDYYAGGRRSTAVAYDAGKVRDLADKRATNTCNVCGEPARPAAYTCGRNACACESWRVRRDAARRAA